MKYRKKPVVIEAHQFSAPEPIGVAPDWYVAALLNRRMRLDEGPCLRISTEEGEMTASAGDWIIRGIKGELYPCRDDIFKLTYEPAELARDIYAASASGATP